MNSTEGAASQPAAANPAPAQANIEPRVAGWRAAVWAYAEPASLRMLLLGFSAGVPLLLVFGTLSLWLREAGIERKAIGFISWVTLAYGFKWTWAPLVDRLALPGLTRMLGRRRSWLLASQLVLVGSIVGMAFSDPQQHLYVLVLFALITAFASATQDIALDAFRIESASVERQAVLAAMYQAGYRVAMIWAGAGALKIAAAVDPTPEAGAYEHAPWTFAYLVMAGSMAVGILTTLLSPEPKAITGPAQRPDTEAEVERWVAMHPRLPAWLGRLIVWLNSAVVSPFADFFTRYGVYAALVLALIATYRVSDVVLGVMANPFYTDLGFSKDDVANVSKLWGVLMTIVGAFIGGVLSIRFGVLRVLFVGAALSALTNLLFAWMAVSGNANLCGLKSVLLAGDWSAALQQLAAWQASGGKPDVCALTLVIAADNLAGGIASSAFIAYLSGLTNVAYSATQYALFSSTMLLLPKFLGGLGGIVVDGYGYVVFFFGTALMGVPVLVLVWLVARKLPPISPGESAHSRSR